MQGDFLNTSGPLRFTARIAGGAQATVRGKIDAKSSLNPTPEGTEKAADGGRAVGMDAVQEAQTSSRKKFHTVFLF